MAVPKEEEKNFFIFPMPRCAIKSSPLSSQGSCKAKRRKVTPSCISGIKKRRCRVRSGWRHEWVSPERLTPGGSLGVHEIIRGPFSSPRLLKTSPFVFVSSAPVKDTSLCSIKGERRGIPDPWKEYLALKGLRGKLEKNRAKSGLNLGCHGTRITETVWKDLGLSLAQGIPDPWKDWPPLKKKTWVAEAKNTKCLRTVEKLKKSHNPEAKDFKCKKVIENSTRIENPSSTDSKEYPGTCNPIKLPCASKIIQVPLTEINNVQKLEDLPREYEPTKNNVRRLKVSSHDKKCHEVKGHCHCSIKLNDHCRTMKEYDTQCCMRKVWSNSNLCKYSCDDNQIFCDNPNYMYSTFYPSECQGCLVPCLPRHVNAPRCALTAPRCIPTGSACPVHYFSPSYPTGCAFTIPRKRMSKMRRLFVRCNQRFQESCMPYKCNRQEYPSCALRQDLTNVDLVCCQCSCPYFKLARTNDPGCTDKEVCVNCERPAHYRCTNQCTKKLQDRPETCKNFLKNTNMRCNLQSPCGKKYFKSTMHSYTQCNLGEELKKKFVDKMSLCYPDRIFESCHNTNRNSNKVLQKEVQVQCPERTTIKQHYRAECVKDSKDTFPIAVQCSEIPNQIPNQNCRKKKKRAPYMLCNSSEQKHIPNFCIDLPKLIKSDSGDIADISDTSKPRDSSSVTSVTFISLLSQNNISKVQKKNLRKMQLDSRFKVAAKSVAKKNMSSNDSISSSICPPKSHEFHDFAEVSRDNEVIDKDKHTPVTDVEANPRVKKKVNVGSRHKNSKSFICSNHNDKVDNCYTKFCYLRRTKQQLQFPITNQSHEKFDHDEVKAFRADMEENSIHYSYIS
ncbi:uncharacterized protein LOC112494630 [Cephus cinctus]|uniref:Uncharacterized protein LOC112494630 n=1 Tax=Cephus cinctus TaxID=211228 RepID=A0AAJ7RKR3_CEPCN|nr:uncharacterized protein LOC112494630 [Cephus cinctus]